MVLIFPVRGALPFPGHTSLGIRVRFRFRRAFLRSALWFLSPLGHLWCSERNMAPGYQRSLGPSPNPSQLNSPLRYPRTTSEQATDTYDRETTSQPPPPRFSAAAFVASCACCQLLSCAFTSTKLVIMTRCMMGGGTSLGIIIRCAPTPVTTAVLLRGTIVNRAYGIHKKHYI